MARYFRVYQKKRGNRRTGSQKLGSVGETVFFAVFFLLGCGGMVVMFATWIIPQWRADNKFVASKCVVVDARLGQKETDNGTLYRPEIQIEHWIDGKSYTSWTYDLRGKYSSSEAPVEEILARFTSDPEIRHDCWYDPFDPNVVVLVRGSGWWAWLALIVPASFILIGGGGLVFEIFGWGKSAERRADMARRASKLDLFENNGRRKSEFPHVPDAANITNSPGTTLAFRLPAATSTTWALYATLLACLLWNGIVSVFAVSAVSSHLHGDPDWFLTIFIIPFVLAGIGLIVFFVRQLLVATGIGPTLVEISDQPLYPGGQYSVFLSQTGRLKLNSLEVLLVCDEEASFRHGTNTRTENMRIYQRSVFHHDGFEVRRGLPFKTECQIEVPAGAMHSFKSGHNEINWKVVVKGDLIGWPGFERSFPVMVYPGHNGNTNA